MKHTWLKAGFILLIMASIVVLLACSRQNPPRVNPVFTSSLQSNLSFSSTPRFSYTPTHTSAATFPITSIPTLEAYQVKNMLQDQEQCQSPCFWGITAGRTTLSESQNILSRLGHHLTRTFQAGEIVFYATSFKLENGIIVSIVLKTKAELVVSVRTDLSYINYNGSSLIQDTAAFNPKTVLNQYGTPTFVEFYISRAPSDDSSLYTISYSMTMYFDPFDLIIKYDSKLLKDEKTIQICPSTENFRGITVWQGKNAENAPNKKGAPLENVTTLTLEQFNNLVLQESDIYCFDLNRTNILP